MTRREEKDDREETNLRGIEFVLPNDFYCYDRLFSP